METKKLADALDENLFSSKLFKKAYVFYAFWLILSPLIETLFCSFGMKFLVMLQMILLLFLFGLTKLFELLFNFRNISFKNKTIVDLLLVILFAWVMLSTIITNTFNYGFMFALCYFSSICLFLNIDKKFFKTMAIVFVAEMVFDSFLGLIDLENKFVPGFDTENFTMSMQFFNPNWSAVVIIIAEILSLMMIVFSQKTWQKILLFVGMIVMSVGLFVGGSYAPETALFVCELAMLIFLWIKNKKCPWWVLGTLLSTIFISFAVWWVPAFRNVTTARANYFYETLAVIDDNLGTSLVKQVSTIFNKLFGWDIFSKVPGSDGWDRAELTRRAMEAVFANFKTFTFGNGCSFISDLRVHDCYLVIWMEFGTIALLTYLAIFVMLLVRFIRVKKSTQIVFLFAGLVMLLFESLFCCIEPFCYPFMAVFFVVVYRELYSAELKPKKDSKEQKIEKK